MTTCPTCNKPVDPLRARAVGVRDGKVVAFCSAECAGKGSAAPGALAPSALAPSKSPAPAPAPRAVAPAKKAIPRERADLDSGPVIEIIHEPASGVVTSAPDRRDTPPAGLPIQVAPDKSARGKQITDEIDPREILGDDDDGDDDRDDDDDAADAADEPGAPERTGSTRARRESVNVKLAEDWLEDEPAEPVRPPTAPPLEEPPRKSRLGVVLLVLALLGGGGWAIYKYVYLPRVAASSTPASPTARLVPGSAEPAEPPPPPAPPEPGAVLERARGVLATYLAAPDSPRVQRAAAMALARTRDPAAIERLATALSEDDLDPVGRIEVAYALGRAGDKRGTDFLARKLRGGTRDDRLGAARRLAQLGDRRAVPPLAAFLEVSQIRLGAARSLAPLAEPRAIATLERVRADADATADDKASAAVALALAGKHELAGELRALLANRGFNAFAAEALAELHDEAARPVLEGQLEVSQLRVRAARALRRLAPERDTRPYLGTLLAMLDDPAKQRDIELVPTAEAILLLAGPASWAEYP